MRKTLKSALSVVLSAAMVLTMGSVGSLTNGTSAKAADMGPNFTANLWSYGTFQDWVADPAASVTVTAGGEYTLTGEATVDLDNLFETSNATVVTFGNYSDLVATGFNQEGGYQIVGKSIQVNDGTAIDWPGEVIETSDDENNARMYIYNGWDGKGNVIPAGTVQPIKAGDKISVTFEVKTGDASADPTEAPSEEPSATPGDATEAPTVEPTVAPTEAPGASGAVAYLNYADGSYANQYWYDGKDYAPIVANNATVTGEGQYTVGLDFSANGSASGLSFTDLEIKDGETLFAGYTIKIDSLKINGSEITLGKGYTVSDNAKDTRYNIYNAWDKATPEERLADGARSWDGVISDASSTPAESVLDSFDDVKTIEVTFTYAKGSDVTAPTEAPTDTPTEAPAQSYNAYLGFQTDVWDYRDEYEKDINSKDYDFVNQAMVGGEPTDVSKVKIENATITGNGTYSVSMTGADLSGGTEFRMLYISTDIPAAMKDVKFSDIKVIIDGAEAATLKDGVVKKEVQDGSKKYYMIMAVNIYGEEGKDLPEAITYAMPQNSLELQFTVSGLDMGQDYTTKTYGAKKGATFTSGNFKYKVTKAATITAGKTAKGKVEVVGLSAAGKKKTSVSVGTSVSYTSNEQKATYTISSLGAGAFKGASKLKTVTLSKNIKSIKKNTFVNCKNLSKLTLKAKLSSVAKNSFKGCKKTIKVSGTSAKANVKKLVKSGYKKFK